MTGSRWLSALLLLFLAACSRREEVRLTFAAGGAPAEVAVWDEILNDFRLQSGIQVEFLRQPSDSDQRRQGLVIPLQARLADPDVFLMDVIWIAQFAASDWLYPLGSRLTDGGEEVFFPRVLRLADRFRGALVALPIYLDGGLLYFRRDLLEQYGWKMPPTTWPELVELAGRAQAEERENNPRFNGFIWQGAQYEGLVCTFLEFASSHGGGLQIDGGSSRLDGPENRQALKFMQDLIHRYRISPPSTYTEMREEEVRVEFQRGNALFERNWPYAWSLHQAEGSPVAGKVGIAPLPLFPGGEAASTLGGWHVGVSRFSDAPEEAWKLLNYLTSYAVQKRLALELGWTPGRRDVYADAEVLALHSHFRELKKIFEHAVVRPIIPYYSQFSAVLQLHLNAALAGRESPEEALAAAAGEIKAIRSRYAEAGHGR